MADTAILLYDCSDTHDKYYLVGERPDYIAYGSAGLIKAVGAPGGRPLTLTVRDYPKGKHAQWEVLDAKKGYSAEHGYTQIARVQGLAPRGYDEGLIGENVQRLMEALQEFAAWQASVRWAERMLKKARESGDVLAFITAEQAFQAASEYVHRTDVKRFPVPSAGGYGMIEVIGGIALPERLFERRFPNPSREDR